MPKKLAAPKSKSAPKSRSAAAKSKPRAKSVTMASWTINQVGDLLDAVNKQTLKRMEKKNDAMAGDISSIKRSVEAIYEMAYLVRRSRSASRSGTS
jgi:hypothetical protein